MNDSSRDEAREVERLFKESREEFFDAHEEGMGGLEGATGRELSERLGDAIERERRAVEKMSEAMRLRQEAVAGRRD